MSEDLQAENERLKAENERLKADRDEAVRIAARALIRARREVERDLHLLVAMVGRDARHAAQEFFVDGGNFQWNPDTAKLLDEWRDELAKGEQGE